MKNPTKKVVVSGMRPTGPLHLGHYFGVLQNWVKLQDEYTCYFFAADWHCLTTEYAKVENVRAYTKDMVINWLAAGVDPEKVTLFIQSRVPEHAELHLLFSMVTPISWLERVPSYKDLRENLKEKDLSTYGFLGYPLLQTADVALYRANAVPVGQDQEAHIELSREVVRRFNHLYNSSFFPEPQTMLTEFPKVPGTDGRKMSKSYDNCLYLSDPQEVTDKKIMTGMTDPARMRRTDPGNPEVCPIFSYHKLVTPEETIANIDVECRRAGIGCVDCKKTLLSHLNQTLAPFRAKRATIKESDVEDILAKGAVKARLVAGPAMEEINKIIGL